MRPVSATLTLLLTAAVFAVSAHAGEMHHEEDAALHAVQFVDGAEGWAVGDDGAIWHTIAAGKEWELVPSHVRASLRSVCFINPYLGWVVGRQELPGGGSTGVLLFTADAGVTWKQVLVNALPGLNVVRFVDDKIGYLAGDGSDQHPSGLFVTADSGQSWQPAPGPRVASWLAGDFTPSQPSPDAGGGQGEGALAGAWNRLGTVRNGKAFAIETDSVGGRDLCGLRLHGKSGVAVGQGGLLLTTNAGGSSWSFADAGLPKNVPCDWDFHAVHGVNKHYWVVGRPGSVVLHSGDDGAHWEVQHTGQPLPLNGVYFADELHGWAVGELGSILATADGGRSWKLQRRGGQRTAALFVHARAAGTPLDTIALLGAQEGYLTAGVRVTAADPAGAALTHCTDAARLCAAVRQAGGAASETLWQFPYASHLAHANRDDLLQAWNALHGDHAADQLLRQLVLALRVWRPDVVVTDAPSPPTPLPQGARGAEEGAADGLVAEAMREAFKDAADPKFFPEQLSVLGLEPWKASKLYGRCDGRTDGQVAIDLTAVSAPLGATLRAFASDAGAVLGDEAMTAPTERVYRFLAGAPGTADHGALMQGVALAPGGLARRPTDTTAAAPGAAKAAHRRAALLALTETPLNGLADPDKLVSRLEPMLHELPDEQAGQAAYAVASHFAQIGQWELARETFLLLADRYPAHPRTPDALRWLIRHGCSSAARHRGELGQFVASGQVSFGQPKEDPAPMPAADAKAVGRGLKLQQFENQESMQIGHVADNEVVRKWYQGALELAPRLAAFGPVYAGDPAMQFCLQSARRNLGDFDGPKKWYTAFVARQPEGPWRNAAAAELWLNGRGGPPPKAVVYCHATDERPFLDGQLDDAAWRAATVLPLTNASGAPAGDYKTEARLAYDREFLYLAVRCGRPAERREFPAKPRTHDADLRGHDRVSLLLDLDRNYATCFHFTVDQRGCIADDCWGDKTWDPRWFVAVHDDETGWVVEAAIPLAALSGDAVTPGRAWCANVIRTVPGQGVQAWSLPAEAPEEALRPEGMGLLIFTQGKPAETSVGAAAP